MSKCKFSQIILNASTVKQQSSKEDWIFLSGLPKPHWSLLVMFEMFIFCVHMLSSLYNTSLLKVVTNNSTLRRPFWWINAAQTKYNGAPDPSLMSTLHVLRKYSTHKVKNAQIFIISPLAYCPGGSTCTVADFQQDLGTWTGSSVQLQMSSTCYRGTDKTSGHRSLTLAVRDTDLSFQTSLLGSC